MIDISGKNFLVDTNILVYLLDKESEFHLQVLNFFEWTEENNHALVVTQQNILELINTLAVDYKANLKQAISKTRRLLGAKEFKIIFPLPGTLDRFFNISKKEGKEPFDLYLTATALDNGVDTIITNNKDDFSGVKGFKALSLEEVTEMVERKIPDQN